MSIANEAVVRIAGLALTAVYASFIGWLYVSQPQTIAEVTGGLASTVGVYRVDATAFAEGLAFFAKDQFVESRAAFERGDPARRDARTQFYIAYSYYRQGWGRVSHDDALYRAGLDTLNHAMTLAPGGRIVVDDQTLMMRSADELKAELEAGLKVDAADFNPLRVFRERK